MRDGAPLRGVRRSSNGRLVERSLLGPPEQYERFSESRASREQRKPASPSATKNRPETRHNTPLVEESATDRERYIEAIEAERRRASEEAESLSLEQRGLAESLPTSERFEIDRDERILAKWSEQQREWHRLSRDLSKSTEKPLEKLVMARSMEEWREQTEVYEIMQSVIPDHVRHAEHYWEMSLRDRGQRIIPVGNIFSGLFCPAKKEPKRPAQIRKLTSETATQQQKWRKNPYLIRRQKQWMAKIKDVPHEVSQSEAVKLAVVGRDLFDWAIESSSRYLDSLARKKELEKRDAEPTETVVVAPIEEKMPEPDPPALAVLGEANLRTLGVAVGLGNTATTHVTLVNRGPTVIYYEWQRTGDTVSDSDYDDDRSISLPYSQSHSLDVTFFALEPRGSLASGCTVDVAFCFASSVPGHFKDDWQLVVAPPETRIDGHTVVSLRGIATPKPEATRKQVALESVVEKQMERSAVARILSEEVVSRIRTPTEVRRHRKIDKNRRAFEARAFGRRLEYSQTRCEAFARLWIETREFAFENVSASEAQALSHEWDGDVSIVRRILDSVVMSENDDAAHHRMRELRSRWRGLTCESSIRVESVRQTLRSDWASNAAQVLATARKVADLQDPPVPLADAEAWNRLLKAAVVAENVENLDVDAFAAACVSANGGTGENAYRAGAVAAIKNVIWDTGENPDLALPSFARVSAARPADLEGRVVLFQAKLQDVPLERIRGRWEVSDEQFVEDTARALLALLPRAVVEKKKKKKSIRRVEETAVSPPRAVVVLTEQLTALENDKEVCASTSALTNALRESCSSRYTVEFVESTRSLSDILATRQFSDTLVPLFILEARTLCCRSQATSDDDVHSDELVLPRAWAEKEAEDAQMAIKAAVEASDVAVQLRDVVDVAVHDDLAAFDEDDDEARRLARLAPSTPRFAGLCLKDSLNAADALLSTHPLVVLLGDLCAGDDEKNGLVDRAAQLDSWLEVADEVLLAGRLAIELLAASGRSVGRHHVDPAIIPTAKNLLIKAARLRVRLRLPTDFLAGDVPVDGAKNEGHARVEEEDEDDEDDDDDEEEEDDSAAEGFEYAGEVSDSTLDNIASSAYLLDIGAATCETYKSVLATAQAIYWAGVPGATQCATFQTATRELAEACLAAKDERDCILVLSSESTVECALRFGELDSIEDAVDHVAGLPFDHLLAAMALPGLDQLTLRDPEPKELQLLSAKRAEEREKAEESDEDESSASSSSSSEEEGGEEEGGEEEEDES